MKKKFFMIIIFSVLLIGLGISVLGRSRGFDFHSWGGVLNQNRATEDDGDLYLVSKEYRSYNNTKLKQEDIYAIGKDIILTKSEVSQAKQFYDMNDSGASEQTDAEQYMMTYNAMYIKSLQEGHYADEEAVRSYVTQLKEMFTDEDAKAALQDVISAFESEDAYWAYEEDVYKKSLPIQNYSAVLQSEFTSENGYAAGSEEFFEEFLQWKEQYQKEVMEAQDFIVIHEGEEIPAERLAVFE